MKPFSNPLSALGLFMGLAALLLSGLSVPAATVYPVNIGAGPNDGTGMSLRSAFDTLNTNVANLNSAISNLSIGSVMATNLNATNASQFGLFYRNNSGVLEFLGLSQGTNVIIYRTGSNIVINAGPPGSGSGTVSTNLQLQSLKVFGAFTNGASQWFGPNYYAQEAGGTFQIIDYVRSIPVLTVESSNGRITFGAGGTTPGIDAPTPFFAQSYLVGQATNIFSGPVRLPNIATNRYLFIDGNSNVVGLAAGGGGGGGGSGNTNLERLVITNAIQSLPQTITISATNAIIDLSSSPNVLLVLTTNTHLVFSNVIDGVTLGRLFIAQDTNGTRSVLSARVVGGNLITNGNPWSYMTTNANALSRWTFGSYLTTNIAVFQDASFSDLVSSSNALFAALSTYQGGSSFLTNLIGTGAITNLFSPTLSNATIKPLVVGIGTAAGATNTSGRIRGIEAGSNVTVTENGSNVVVAATVVTNLVTESVGAITQTNGAATAITTISGVGGANTNFTGQATDGVVYINAGTTNVNFVAIMPGQTALQYFPVYVLTNLTASDRLLSLASTTNRWVNLQGYDGITLPVTITNKHTAWLAVSLQGSNAFWAIKQATNGF